MHRITVTYDVPAGGDRAALEEFDSRYRVEHVPLVHALPGLLRFTTSRPRGLTGETPYLVAEMWFESEEQLAAALRSPEMAAAGEHAQSLGAPMTTYAGAVVEQ